MVVEDSGSGGDYGEMVKRKTAIESMMKEMSGVGCSLGGLLGVCFLVICFILMKVVNRNWKNK